jgi:hypothetical protein
MREFVDTSQLVTFVSFESAQKTMASKTEASFVT